MVMLIANSANIISVEPPEEYTAMAKSKLKQEKPEETTEEFVRRINQKDEKRNGLKKNFVWQKRRHSA